MITISNVIVTLLIPISDDLCTPCILQNGEKTALNFASEKGYLEIVKGLIEGGAMVDLNTKVRDSIVLNHIIISSWSLQFGERYTCHGMCSSNFCMWK